MNRDLGLQTLIIYAICLPLAILMGYILGKGSGFFSYAVVGLMVLTLALPLIVNWYHWLVICTLNSTLLVFFLPGRPELGAVMAVFGVGVAIVNRTLTRESAFLWVRSVALPLILLGIVVTLTAYFTGGIGGRVFGSEMWGAKRYLGVYGAIFAFFALISKKIPQDKAHLAASLFFLAAVTSAISNLVYTLGPSFYFLFNFFPTDLASHQYRASQGLVRLSGLSFAAMAVIYFLMLRYGIQGLLDLRRPWRLVLLLALLVVSLMGGFRSILLMLAFVTAAQFYLEGLYRSRFFFPALAVAIITGGFFLLFLDQMPLAIQRSFSFLPVDIAPAAARDAASTLDWRLSMWRVVLPDVPQYLLFGKGYAFDGTEYFLTTLGIERGIYPAYEHTLVSGNYHQGILTIVVPFGIWGLLAFLWFSAAGWWVLYRNFQYGHPQLLRVNQFLLAYFSGMWLFYVFLYGQFDLEFVQFTGAVGLSIAINHGVASPQDRRQQEEANTAVPETAAEAT